MPVQPTAKGALRISRPAPGLRYDLGNPRLFAFVDGTGGLPLFRLPEGVAVLSRWTVQARVDGVPVYWLSAEAIGRSWALSGAALDTHVMLRTVCDAANPALFQVWAVENGGSAPRVFTLSLEADFDLRLPQVRVGASSLRSRLYTFLRDSRVSRRMLGARRWGLSNRVTEAQKRQPAKTQQKPPELMALSDGFVARGDIAATLRAGEAPSHWETHPGGVTIQYRAVIEPGAQYTLPVIVAAGEGADPAGYRAALADADAYAAWLSAGFEHKDALLRSLYVASLNTALSMYKELPSGFRGLWAGPGYAFPPRIYFRDGYWTGLVILPYRPAWVRDHLLALAAGVRPDGVCPSGVIDISILPFEDQDEDGAAEWLPDHHDSPSFFVLLLHAYLAWTGDMSILREQLDDGRTIWACAQACLNHLLANPAKDRAPNDWADNVLRSEWVTYDLALLYGALHAAAAIARQMGENSAAAAYTQDAHHIGGLLHIHGWDHTLGHYVDYRRTGDAGGRACVEDHLALDTLLALRFGAAPAEKAEQVMLAARQRLQTRHNAGQPYGDWGVMCCWPLYRRRADLFGKSARPYTYHNGAVWPYLSAIYAELLLERGDRDWRYALARWWEIHLEKEWLTPVEYYSPAAPPGAPFQGWSGLAAVAMRAGGLGLCPDLDGEFRPRVPPWGPCVLHNLTVHGRPIRVVAEKDGARVESE